MPFHHATADEIGDAAAEVRDGAGDAYDTGSNEVQDFVESSSDTISPYVESGQSHVTRFTNAATDQFLSVSDYVYHQAEYAFENPVRTGEQMAYFFWGGHGEPPDAVHDWATDRGYSFVGVTAVDKVCETISALGIIGSVAVGMSGGPITAVGYAGAGAACDIAGFVSAYAEDVVGCDVNNVAVYVRQRSYFDVDVFLVPACG